MSTKDPNAMSLTMLDALAFAKEHGGTLHRYPGGFWLQDNLPGGSYPGHVKHYGTQTVEALVKRGAMRYTRWQQHRGGAGQFPIEATLT